MGARSVLVTGASSGIGAAAALRLARRGFHVYAGVRKPSDGEALEERAGPNLEPLKLDVTDAESIEAAVQHITRQTGDRGLAGLVNNAGIAVAGPVEFLETEDWRAQFEVNVFGAVAVTRACLPLLRRGQGRIVNMSSLSGRFAPPFMGPYSSSKHALEAISDALRIELQPWAIDVAVVEPGSIATPIWEKGVDRADAIVERLPTRARELYGEVIDTMRSQATEMGERGIPPRHVARAVEHALAARRPRTRYVVGRDAKMTLAATRFLPDRVRDRLVTWQGGLPGRKRR